MKVLRYNEFDLIDTTALKYIDGDITFREFENYLNVEILNESLADLGSFIKEKILNVLNTFLVKAAQIGFKVIEKFKTIFTWIINTVSKWKEKHPVLYKVILITLITIILLMVSASSAYAQSTGKPVEPAQINVAIGWLELLKGKTDIDVIEVNKAIAHLIDLKDGTIEITELGDKAIQIADSALETSGKMIDEAKTGLDKGDESIAKMCLNLMEKGSQYVSAFYSKIQDTETVKLTMK